MSSRGSSDLGGLDPRDLLNRGLESAPDVSSWEPPSPDEIGKLLPRYRVERLLGRGGMGAVYQALQTDLDRPVAIKILPAEAAENEAFVARFQREARILARLRHPGFVGLYDFGRTMDGLMYFTMEYVDGSDLNTLIRGRGLSARRAVEIMVEICAALQCAHSVGVVHRDIKPANILIAREGHAKLADFGVALPPTGQEASLTRSHAIIGSAAYMAPEQRQGRECDQRADIFSLGVVFYEMLTGRLPRGAFHLPSRKVNVDLRVDGIVLKALQEDPNRRYQRVIDLELDLEQIRQRPLPSVDPVLAAAREESAKMQEDSAPGEGPGTTGQKLFGWSVATAVLFAALVWFLAASGRLARFGISEGPAVFKRLAGALNVNATPTPSLGAAPLTPVVQALLASEWSISNVERARSEARMLGVYTFDEDGKARCEKIDGFGEWRATGPRSFTILNRGRDIGLGWVAIEFSFNGSLTSFSGARPGEGGMLHGALLKPRSQATPAPKPAPPVATTNPATLDEALKMWKWTWIDAEQHTNGSVEFPADGAVLFDDNKIWLWAKTGDHRIRVRLPGSSSVDLTFDQTFSAYSGSFIDDALRTHAITGRRTILISGKR